MSSQKPKYRITHKKNIIKEASFSKTKLEPGHIVRFSYSGKDVTSKRPLVLVLHPKWKGQMHGLNLDYMSESVLKQLWDITKIELAGKIQKLTKLRLPLLKADIGNPRGFYNSRLKKFLRGKLGSTGVAYRTYKVGSIASLKIIDYRFEGAEWAQEEAEKHEKE
tara:strand:- start:75 stop:566 length:492 start_codon:yes stop_codon:yes gene_type:complete